MFCSKKKTHFVKRLEAVQKSIWDAEFQKSKLQMVKEGIRQQYDKLNETSEMAKKRIEEEDGKEAKDPKVIENLQNLIAKYSPDIEQLKKQMSELDMQIDGEYNPESITAKIDAMRSLKEMLGEFIKKL